MQPVNILLVDDQLSSLVALETILEGLKADLHKASSVKQALRVMLERRFDCILLDVSMPEMDGFDFLETLKRAPAHANIPVIMVTGKVFSENETLRAYQYGAVDFLLKPLDSEIVYRKVSFFVQQAQRMRCLEGIEQQIQQMPVDMIEPLQRLHTTLDNEDSSKDPIADVLTKLQALQEHWHELRNSNELRVL